MYICIHISLLLECCMCGVPPARQEAGSTSCSARAVMYHLCYVLRRGEAKLKWLQKKHKQFTCVCGWLSVRVAAVLYTLYT